MNNKVNKYVMLNNIQTHIINWAQPFNCNGADVIVCISGNPGVPDFYTAFGTFLHENTKLPVCVIGQAGHEEVPDKQSNVLYGQEHLFDLNGQIQHKLDLITSYIDKNSKIHLIGHSIGSWMILEMLHKNNHIVERVSSINLLFPTIQRMAESKSGIFLNNVIRNIHPILMILIMLLYIIPECIIRKIVNMYLNINDIPQHFDKSIMKFLNPNVIEKVLFLAYNEMDKVRLLNYEIIGKIKTMTNVLYSPRDGWAPLHYMEELQQFEPQITLKQVDVEHAFVLKDSDTIANMVSHLIKNKMKES